MFLLSLSHEAKGRAFVVVFSSYLVQFSFSYMLNQMNWDDLWFFFQYKELIFVNPGDVYCIE